MTATGSLGIEVVDFHAHFGPGDLLEPYARRYVERFGQRRWEILARRARVGQRRWQRSWGFPEPDGVALDWEVEADRWAAEMAKNGLSLLVFVTGGGNETLARVVARHPGKFAGFAHHDPFGAGAAAELERAVKELGLRGYKILAPLLAGRLDDPSLYGLWETVERLGVPVLVHFGVLGGAGGIASHENINPLILHDVAKGFPEINFVVPHFGGGYLRELLQLCWVCENVHIDSSGNNEWLRWMPVELSLREVFRRAYETVGPERLIFGSDSSWFPRGFARAYLVEQFRACREINLPEEHLRLVFGGNASRLLGLASPGAVA